MADNLIILGNGFDLAHGLKTSYKDFVEVVIRSRVSGSLDYKDLLDFKGDKGKFNEYHRDGNIHDWIDTSQIFSEMVRQVNLQNWCDIERLYFKMLQTSKTPQELNRDFERIKEGLEHYLSTLPLPRKSENYTSLFKELYDQNLVVNFNYTSVNKLYFRPPQVIDIHGRLKSNGNPIIFGYAATERDNRELLNKNNVDYLQNIKRYSYNRTTNNERLQGFLDDRRKINVLIFGHSCGVSDILILKQIFDHHNVEKIYIFYHQDFSAYKNLSINIDRLTEQNDSFNKIVDFPHSLEMPQSSMPEEFPYLIDRFKRSSIYE